MSTKQKINSNAKINPSTKIIYPDDEDSPQITNSDCDTNTKSDSNDSDVPKIFREKIVKFIKLDDAIREETIAFKEKIETLKIQKEELSAYILRHLEDVERESVDLGNKGKIARKTSTRKSGLNKDIIQQSIYEKLKNDKLVKTDEEGRILAQATYEIMEGKRDVKTKVVLSRTIKRKKKSKDIADSVQQTQDQLLEKKPRKTNK